MTKLRLAMWSGPRNVSTALMRSFGSRPDTIVCDEPLYAHYLRETGLAHPGADEILQTHDANWESVATWLAGPLPAGKSVFYQKHMAHHLLPHIGRAWLSELRHAFLIREPRAMLTSLLQILPEPRLEDTGLPQQLALFHEERANAGAIPPVMDSADLLKNPGGELRALCDSVGLEFTEAMLSWEPGLRDTDGCWAQHWYGNALKSTSFAPFRQKDTPVPEDFRGLCSECDEIYTELHAHRLTT